MHRLTGAGYPRYQVRRLAVSCGAKQEIEVDSLYHRQLEELPCVSIVHIDTDESSNAAKRIGVYRDLFWQSRSLVNAKRHGPERYEC